ncbi:Uncharacterised protein [Mycobacteroides abscessus subsp. abscessus]|nr:Uncharacterised protein [Mycobacteroides abscessus subsp. abscessus]SIN15024.1 Uncharacterised protein [Mycobacteroides abscessus subsp. abscessus]
MKQCCERTMARLAATDSLVDTLMIVHNERDLARRAADVAEQALRRVGELHESVLRDGEVTCVTCGGRGPCDTAKVLRRSA